MLAFSRLRHTRRSDYAEYHSKHEAGHMNIICNVCHVTKTEPDLNKRTFVNCRSVFARDCATKDSRENQYTFMTLIRTQTKSNFDLSRFWATLFPFTNHFFSKITWATELQALWGLEQTTLANHRRAPSSRRQHTKAADKRIPPQRSLSPGIR